MVKARRIAGLNRHRRRSVCADLLNLSAGTDRCRNYCAHGSAHHDRESVVHSFDSRKSRGKPEWLPLESEQPWSGVNCLHREHPSHCRRELHVGFCPSHITSFHHQFCQLAAFCAAEIGVHAARHGSVAASPRAYEEARLFPQ